MVKAFMDLKAFGEKHWIVTFNARFAFWHDMRHLKIETGNDEILIRIIFLLLLKVERFKLVFSSN